MYFLLVQSWEIVLKEIFLVQCHFTGLQLIIVFSYGPLYFYGIGYNFFFFIFLFYWFGPSPFLSWWVCLKVDQFCLLFSKNKLFVSLIFSIEFINAVLGKKKKKNIIKWGKELNRHFFFQKGKMQIDNSYIKTCSTPLIIREMQIKTTMSLHCTPVRMTIIEKNADGNCWWLLLLLLSQFSRVWLCVTP